MELVLATPDQASVIANLLQLYAHDFSEFHPVELGADGRYEYHQLPLYWNDPGRHAFLIQVDGKLAGFALVKRGSEVSDNPDVWDVAEFFIVRGYRRQGIGTKAAHALWSRFPGRWEVRVMESNPKALSFWRSAIATLNGEEIQPDRIQKNGECWFTFTFDARPND